MGQSAYCHTKMQNLRKLLIAQYLIVQQVCGGLLIIHLLQLHGWRWLEMAPAAKKAKKKNKHKCLLKYLELIQEQSRIAMIDIVGANYS